MADQEEDFSSLPLAERFVHKNWKVRKEAYEAAAKDFDSAQSENDAVVRQFVQDSNLWKGAVGDSNVAAQQEALGALCSFLQIAGQQGCVRTRGSTIVPIVEKGLAATRPAAKQKALEALLLYIEVDKPDPIIEELLPILSHKQPKIIAATLSALTSIYHNYGCKTVEPKPTLKLLPKAFGHADKNVRAEAQNLTVELYRWLKDAMKPLFWNDLKPVQQTDLEKLFEKVRDEPPPKQERLLRSQQAIEESVPVGAGPDADGVIAYDDEAEIDLELEFEAVNVMSKIPKDLQERLSSTKWKDRKEALDDLHQAINHPKIEEGPFDDILRSLAKCMKDANIAVVTVAANCIEILANGLGKGFAKYRNIVMTPMMERLKEKKQSVTDAISAALDAVSASVSIGDCLEEILEFLKHKNPQVKLESTRFLIRCLKTSKQAPHSPEVKSIADAATKLLTDSQEVQRAAGAEVLGTLWKIMGDRIMNPHLEGLDDIRKTKIKEFYESAEVKAKFKPKATAPPPPKPSGAGPPGQRRSVALAGKKPPGPGLKKPAAAPAPSYDEPAATPLAARPSSRPVSKIGPPKSGLTQPGSLRPPSGLLQKKAPGLGGPLGGASPARRIASPVEEEPAPPAPPPPKMGFGPSRGLAGRPLGRPAPAEATAPTTASGLTGINSADRAELEELRIENDRLRRETDSLRSQKSMMMAEVQDLTNQYAQLKEDHTREVLSVKAKETQLVRLHSDLDSSRQEIERLKRELGRQVRAMSPAPIDLLADHGLYGNNGAAVEQASNGALSYRSSRYVTSPTGKMVGSAASAGVGSQVEGPMSGLSTGAGFGSSPRRNSRMGMVSDGTSASLGSLSGSGGAESWKRAAEVTQNLKARIELMKAKQGFSSSRPH